jgi:hypothetical protein
MINKLLLHSDPVEMALSKVIQDAAVTGKQAVAAGWRFENGTWRGMDADGAVNEDLFLRAAVPSRILEASEMEMVAAGMAEAVEDAKAKLKESLDAYDATLKKMRGQAQNDVAAVKAQTERLSHELRRLTEQAQVLTALWTSEAMLTSITNAERLATALEALQGLPAAQITFAVLGGSK